MSGAEYRDMIANSCRHPVFLELCTASGSMSRNNGEDSVDPSEIIAEDFSQEFSSKQHTVFSGRGSLNH